MTRCVIKKCPCRTWVNCSYYSLIRYRSSHAVDKTEVFDWYNIHFRVEYEAPDSYCNG